MNGWLCKIFIIPIQLKLGLYQSGSLHPASQTKIGLPPAVRMLHWLLSSPQEQKSNRLLVMEGGWVLRRGNWGGLGAPQQHRQPLADPPHSLNPKISAFYNRFTSLRIVRTLDAEPAECRAGTQRPLLHPPRSLRYPPYHPVGSGWHYLQQSHAGAS